MSIDSPADDALARSYEEIPYVSGAFWYSHPNALASVAILGGMDPAPVARCRVLELGCASGGNLLPMAEMLPDSRFVGIDLAAGQVAEGRRIIEALGLGNVRLDALSISDVPDELTDDFGQFDYILCHGVYSWVPPQVQEKILCLCANHLAPCGVAYISYNTYPGWHLRQAVREMMLFHVEGIDTAADRVAQAQALVQFLHDNAPQDLQGYKIILADELRRLEGTGMHYLLHEHLDSHNQPLYLHEFVARAKAAGLRYIGESRQVGVKLSPQARQVLVQLGNDRLRLEQYTDFLTNRMFRWSLLARHDAPAEQRSVVESVGRLKAAGPLGTEAREDQIDDGSSVVFESRDDSQIRTSDPFLKRALRELANAWPQVRSLEQLCAAAKKGTNGEAPANLRHQVAETLVRAFLSGSLDLLAYEFPFLHCLSERPAVSPLVRFCAANDLPITNRRHHTIKVNELQRLVVALLDGSRTRDDLVNRLSADVASGELQISAEGAEGGAAPDPAKQRQFLETFVDETLNRVATGALLVG